MLSTLFQPEISTIESQIAQLQAQIAQRQDRIVHLNEAKTTADTAIAFLESALEKISVLSPTAIASLKSAVLSLFEKGDNPPSNDDGGDQPINPTPNSDLCGQCSPYDPDKYWRIAEPDGSAWELASELCCLLCDAPVTGKSQYAELVKLTDSLAYMRKCGNGEILATYLGFSSKSRAKNWGEHLAMHRTAGGGFEVRLGKRLTDNRHELKVWGLTIQDIEHLAKSDLSKNPPPGYNNAPKRQPISAPKTPQPARIEELEIGDIVCSISVPTWEYQITEIKDDILTCDRLNSEPPYSIGIKVGGVALVSKRREREALESIQPPLSDFNYSAHGQGYRDAARKNQMRNNAIANGWKPTKGTGLSTLQYFQRMEAQQKQFATVAADDSELDF